MNRLCSITTTASTTGTQYPMRHQLYAYRMPDLVGNFKLFVEIYRSSFDYDLDDMCKTLPVLIIKEQIDDSG